MEEGEEKGRRIDQDDDGDDSAIAATAKSHRHFKMYKPPGVLTQFSFTHRKRRNRTLLGDVHPHFPPGTMAVGRLDEDSEGLLLLTTDGRVSEMMRRKSVEKEYWVQVAGRISEGAMERLRRGVEMRRPRMSSEVDGGGSGGSVAYTTLPCKARLLDTAIVEAKHITAAIAKERSTDTSEISTKRSRKRSFKGTCNICGGAGHKSRECSQNLTTTTDASRTTNGRRHNETLRSRTMSLPPGVPVPSGRRAHDARGETSWISLTITEGKNRQVRRMTAAVGHPTLRLVRARVGSITLDGMTPGEVRELERSDMFPIDTS
mmetsp:Transcript_5888/g.14751  ORF Transcript_5888/g.14751 Transcript_5888/m.14751 type:complete len:318 (+) Transcript_5888:33-986(+)